MKWEYIDCIGEEDVLKRFCSQLRAYAEECIEWHKYPTKMNISEQEESQFQSCTKCWICDSELVNESERSVPYNVNTKKSVQRICVVQVRD